MGHDRQQPATDQDLDESVRARRQHLVGKLEQKIAPVAAEGEHVCGRQFGSDVVVAAHDNREGNVGVPETQAQLGRSSLDALRRVRENLADVRGRCNRRDSVRDGDAAHFECLVPVVRPVIQTREDVGMQIDHDAAASGTAVFRRGASRSSFEGRQPQ